MERARHRNRAMTTAGLLLCLVLATTFLVCGMLARYTSTGAGRDVSRVAKFDVTGTGFTETIDLNVKMNPGDEGAKAKSFSFLVTNNSEVAVEYTVTLRNTTNHLPVVLMVDGAAQAGFATDEGYTYTATLAANGGAGSNFEFSLSWPAAENDLAYSGQLDNIAVTVTATQVD